MNVVKSKLKAQLRRATSSNQDRAWLEVLKGIKKKHGNSRNNNNNNNNSSRNNRNNNGRQRNNQYDDDFAGLDGLNDDDGFNGNGFNDGFNDDFNDDYNDGFNDDFNDDYNDDYNDGFNSGGATTLSLAEMTAFVEKTLDGRDIRDKMGDHEGTW
jgi:hypothetical protein